MTKWIATGLISLFLTSCGMVGGPVSGVVLDAETRQPIEGAFVVAKWSGSSPATIADSQTVCIYIDMARTDEKGRFRIPMWLFEKPGVSGQWRGVRIYRPGYMEVWPREDDELLVKKADVDVKERIKQMYGIVSHTSCGGNDKARVSLYPLAVALYEESLSLAGGKYDKDIVEPFLYDKEVFEIGEELAFKRHLER